MTFLCIVWDLEYLIICCYLKLNVLNAKPQSQYFGNNIKLTLSSVLCQLLQLFLRGSEHVCLLMRRNLDDMPKKFRLMPLTPDFYEYSRMNPLPDQKQGSELKKQGKNEHSKSPFYCAIPVQSNLKPPGPTNDNKKRSILTELRDASEPNATANNQETPLSIGGKSSYTYGQSLETSSGYNYLNAQYGPSSTNITLNDASIFSRQNRDMIFDDHSLSSPQTEQNTLQIEGLLSSHEHNQRRHQERTTTNELTQALAGTQASPHQDPTIITSRVSADNPPSSIQEMYPPSLGQTIPRLAIGTESQHNGQANAAITQSKSLHQHISMIQNQHALTTAGMALRAPLPALLVPGMYQNNALEKVLNSSIYNQLSPPWRIQVGPGTAIYNNFSRPTINIYDRHTSELITTSTPTLTANLQSAGQRSAQQTVIGRTITPFGTGTSSDPACFIVDPIISNPTQQTSQFHPPPNR